MNIEHDPDSAIVIREADSSDVSLILSLIKGIAEYERLAHTVETTEEMLRTYLFGEKRYAEVLIAFLGEEPAGYALYFHNYSTFTGRPGMYLEDLFVKPEYRGKGIGFSLLKRVAHIAVERNCGRMEWSVLDWNDSAIAFYQKLGAVPMDGWTVYRLTENELRNLIP
jgi:GNAT superfamily N-acetyltransferase